MLLSEVLVKGEEICFTYSEHIYNICKLRVKAQESSHYFGPLTF